MPVRNTVLFFATLSLGLASLAFADIPFTLNPVSDCGQAPYFGGQTFYLAAGPHQVRWDSGAISFWSSNGANAGNSWLPFFHMYVHATGEDLGWSTGQYYPSYAAASAAGAGSLIDIDLAVGSLVSFFVSDSPCGDNRGSAALTLLETPTAETRELPLAFALRAPVPNPFNPTTTLAFTLPETGPVNLAVYDLRGRLVTQLLNGMLARGEHKIVLEAAGEPSGVYIARLGTERGQSTQKLLLVK